jgi:TonB family protein
MMCKKTSSRWSAAKLLLILPLVALSLAATATTVYVPKEQNKGNENFVIEQESENSTIRISDEKIYLNSEEIPFDELKERVQDFHQINLVADKGTTMGEVADVRSELRENPELKVNYLANDTVKINSTQHLTVQSVKSVPMEDLKKSDTIEMKSVTGESIWVRYIGDGSSALVLIDGKEGNMEDLKVEDIEYFTVVKNEEALKAYGEKGKNGVILITTKQATQQVQATEDTAFIKVESMPTFQGGDLNGYRNWVQSQLQYPAEAKEKGIKGRVIFSFVVEKDGSVSEFKVLNTPDKLLSAEVERVFKLTPKWEPGKQNGNAVRVKFTVPIVFTL